MDLVRVIDVDGCIGVADTEFGVIEYYTGDEYDKLCPNHSYLGTFDTSKYDLEWLEGYKLDRLFVFLGRGSNIGSSDICQWLRYNYIPSFYEWLTGLRVHVEDVKGYDYREDNVAVIFIELSDRSKCF